MGRPEPAADGCASCRQLRLQHQAGDARHRARHPAPGATGSASSWSRSMMIRLGVIGMCITGVQCRAATRSSPTHARAKQPVEEQSPIKALGRGVPRAIELATLEQELEDINVMSKYDKKLERLLMVMPLTEQFEPPLGNPSHGHLQTGDKVSMPKSLLYAVLQKKKEVPWQFEVQRVRRVGPGRFEPVELPAISPDALLGKQEMPQLTRVLCSILDYRSPEQYVFLPDWMMKALRLKPRDVVRFRHVDLPKGGLVVFQPHTGDFHKLSNSLPVLEEELRRYSAATKGTTISMQYNKKVYRFNVVDCQDPEGKSVDAVCVQDTDIRTDFAPALDDPKSRRKATPPKAAPAPAQTKGGRRPRPSATEATEYDDSSEEEL